MKVTHKYDKAFQMLERIGEIETLSRNDILEIHDTLIERIGGSYGIRDEKLLESVVLSPYQNIFGKELYPTLFDKAGKYLFDFCKYQIFVDGNKRTGVAAAEVFLNLNGYEMTFTNEEIYRMAINIAVNQISDPLEIGKIIKDHVKFFEQEQEQEYDNNSEERQSEELQPEEFERD